MRIIGRRRPFRRFGRYLADRIGQTRQTTEQAWHEAVDATGDPGAVHHQFFGRRRVVARIAAQIGDERLAAGEARAGRHRLHLGPDARHFRQAQIVNLVGGQIGGRLLPDAERIIARAIGLGRYTDRARAARQIALNKPRAVAAQCGIDAVFDDAAHFGLQRRPVGIAGIDRLGPGEGRIIA